ncbi:MAG TPA: DUF2304 domain-containing protein [Bdellovibrionota bacterium]|jgi:hypothetical protein|nr:DUF2304 domain-containing protein [Bdellovibrionota bacterium]
MILAFLVLGLSVVMGAVDWVSTKRESRRILLLEYAGFTGVFLLALNPDGFNRAAAAVGVGRGVDLIIYPLVVWLFREAILSRVRYHQQQREITRLVRALAVGSARDPKVY